MKHILLSSFLLICSFTFGQTLYDSLVVFYPMNGDFTDASGNSYDATSQNGLTPTTDRFGNTNSAMYFDGIDDFVNLPNILALKPDLPVTFSFWINSPAFNINSNRWFATEDSYNQYSGFFSWGSADGLGKVVAGYGTGGTQSSQYRRNKVSNTTLTINTWHHVVCVIKGEADIDIYIDCNNAGGTYGGTGASNVSNLGNTGTLGHSYGNTISAEDFFNGSMDDLAFWNRELSISEIVEVCNDGLYTGIEENTSTIEVKAFPNPATENIEFNFKASQQEIEITLYNSLGQSMLSSSELNTNKVIMDLSDIASGLYFAKIKTDNGINELKIVKE